MAEQKLLSVTWRLQVSVVKSEMELSASFEIRFLILILWAHSKWTNGMPNVTACLGVQLCVSRQRKSGGTAVPCSRRTAD